MKRKPLRTCVQCGRSFRLPRKATRDNLRRLTCSKLCQRARDVAERLQPQPQREMSYRLWSGPIRGLNIDSYVFDETAPVTFTEFGLGFEAHDDDDD